MTVRAKFTVTSITDLGQGANIHFQVVYTGSPENEDFFQYTPSGSIVLYTVNPEAAKQFETGKEYYVDFTAAES